MAHKYTTPVDVKDAHFDSISRMVYKSYPKSCIIRIDSIHNLYLSSKFELCMEYAKYPFDIKQLFHGTNEKFVDSIIENGFTTRETYVSSSCSKAL